MRTQLQIHFHGIDTSPALEASIREKSNKLEQFHPNVTSCRVVVQRPHNHKQQGEEFLVSIDVSVPGGNIVANQARRQDVHVALRDAFFAARRQLDAHVRRLRIDAKRRVEPRAIGSASDASGPSANAVDALPFASALHG